MRPLSFDSARVVCEMTVILSNIINLMGLWKIGRNPVILCRKPFSCSGKADDLHYLGGGGLQVNAIVKRLKCTVAR